MLPAKIKNMIHWPFFNLFSKEVWAFTSLTFLSIFVLIRFVNLVPEVDDNFFFSSDDPQFQSEQRIDELFIRKDTQLIISATGDIRSSAYTKNVSTLSEALLKIEGVSSVNSITHFGPNNVKAALNSPLWKRLIISDDQRSTNLIVLLEENRSSEIIPKVERAISRFSKPDFQLKAAGLPYVIELIKRNLQRDLKIFTSLAVIIFGLFIFKLFHSKGVLLGTILCCFNACIWTLMILQLMHVPLGLLTANLGTIIFVMTLSHIIFLTYNWRNLLADGNKEGSVEKAVDLTFTASFWSMLTTLLGFVSLMSVPAKPLRELGLSGSIGAVIAIIVAYGIFPHFLRVAHLRIKENNFETIQNMTFIYLDKRRKYIATGIFVAMLLALPGLLNIKSDPSLLSYFSKSSEIYQGFSYIDHNGGSSPLLLVVRSKDDQPLNTSNTYNKLSNLQEALEQHRAVGSVISLPVLIAQAKKTALGWIFPKEWLLDVMASEKYDKISKSFVTENRKYGLFLLRMREIHRSSPRLKIVDEIQNIARVHGFNPEIVGGIYNLQGHLSKLVASSLIT
ncbi:MAG: MMPL family transporter, partial [Candidatus Omnitrophica bacterium]|nr:MMPL family transporter [Candidatus Omnitrophota bacterium]